MSRLGFFSIGGYIPGPLEAAEAILAEYGPELSPEQVRALGGPEGTVYARQVVERYASLAYEVLTGQPF